MDALRTAITKAGSQAALARLLGIRQGHVWNWLNRDEKVPARHCLAIETHTGVRCEDLRPDVEWERDETGVVVSYRVPVAMPAIVTPAGEPANACEVGGGEG